MKREDAIANLKMIKVAFTDPVTAEQAKLIDDTFDLAVKALTVFTQADDKPLKKYHVYCTSEAEVTTDSDDELEIDLQMWTPIKYELPCVYDCPLPDDGQDVLITTCNGNVVVDTFCRDYEGCYFETYCDDGDVVAWMPLPEPYKAESEEK